MAQTGRDDYVQYIWTIAEGCGYKLTKSHLGNFLRGEREMESSKYPVLYHALKEFLKDEFPHEMFPEGIQVPPPQKSTNSKVFILWKEAVTKFNFEEQLQLPKDFPRVRIDQNEQTSDSNPDSEASGRIYTPQEEAGKELFKLLQPVVLRC